MVADPDTSAGKGLEGEPSKSGAAISHILLNLIDAVRQVGSPLLRLCGQGDRVISPAAQRPAPPLTITNTH
jgi:hypothetical protein